MRGDSAPMLQALDADLVVLGFERLRRLAIEGHEGRIVDAALDQRFGEFDAGTRRSAVGIDRVVDDAEALAGAQIFEGGLNFRIRRKFEACLVGAERRTPGLAVFERLGERCQRVRAGRSTTGQEIAVDRRHRPFIGHRIIAGDGVGHAGEFQPQRLIVGIDGQRALHRSNGEIDIAAGEGSAPGFDERVASQPSCSGAMARLSRWLRASVFR